MKILHLAPTLKYSGAGRHILTLAPAQVQSGEEVVVCCLGQDGPWGQRLRSQGVKVQALGWTRVLDPLPLWNLQRLLVGFQPEIIHAWQASALRSLALFGKTWLRRAVVSRFFQEKRATWSRFDRGLLQRVGRVLVQGDWEVELCRSLGLISPRVALVRPGLSLEPAEPMREKRFAGPVVACPGPLHVNKGIRSAIWTLDMMAFRFPDLQLLIIGEGPEEARLRRFAAHTPHAANVHFTGPAANLGSVLAQADLCWLPHLHPGGGTSALEAQAAGCPIIASMQPALAELVRHGDTGLLIPPGDKVALGRATRTLLLDSEKRRSLGAAGKKWVQDSYPAQGMIEGCARQYRQLAG